MDKNSYFQLSSLVFLLAGALHLWRALQGWDLMLGPHLIPMWISWVVVVLAGALAYHGHNFKK